MVYHFCLCGISDDFKHSVETTRIDLAQLNIVWQLNFLRSFRKLRLTSLPLGCKLALVELSKSIHLIGSSHCQSVVPTTGNLNHFIRELVCDLNRRVSRDCTIVAKLAKVVVANGKDSLYVRLFFSAKEVARSASESHINHFELLLFEKVELEEVGEEATQSSDLRSKTKLAKLVVSLNQNLVGVSQQSRVPRTRAHLFDLVENEVVRKLTRFSLVDFDLHQMSVLSQVVET